MSRSKPGSESRGMGEFFMGSTQDEALARLHYLSDRQKRLGVVHGAHGVGKTWALQRYAAEVRRRGCDVALLDLAGRDGREFLHQLADGLLARVSRQEARFQLWRGILDRLTENRLLQTSTIVVCDHVDEATDEVRGLLLRLLHAADEPGAGLTVVLATTLPGAQGLDLRLRERVDLHVELEPWTMDDVARYVQWCSDRETHGALAWEDGVAESLWRTTGGTPRAVARLVDLTLVAARSERESRVTVEMCESVRSELVLH
ncbi:MAG: ATP-binding protein [Pirellulales bacterium]